jgi:hypothetical protein
MIQLTENMLIHWCQMGAAPINLTVQLKAGEQQQYVFPVAWIRYKDRSTLVNLYTGGKRVITPEELNSAEALMEYQFVNAVNRNNTGKSCNGWLCTW